MTYELAKQLKEAGFRQNTEKAFYINAGKNTGALVDVEMYSTANQEFRDEKLVACPTLSELIEACADGFVSLDRFGLTNLGLIQWVCNHEKAWRTEGQTPEEAVARLWLELKKNK